MEQNLENNDWKKEAPLLAGLPLSNPFSVPEGYFEGLADQISSTTYLEGLRAKVTETGFTTPEHYFEELKENMNSRIFLEGLKPAVPHNNGQTIPVNYFKELQASILAKTINEITAAPQPKIIRLWRSNLLKYASAACFLIVASFGVFYFNQQSHPVQQLSAADLATEQMLFDIDEQLIIEHIEANYKEPAVTASDAALESYILSNYSQSDIVNDL